MAKKKFEDFKNNILKKEKEGKIVTANLEGFIEVNLDTFISQPIEGILYDLNRDRITVLANIEDQKWVNDFAVMLVITKLKDELEREKLLHELEVLETKIHYVTETENALRANNLIERMNVITKQLKIT